MIRKTLIANAEPMMSACSICRNGRSRPAFRSIPAARASIRGRSFRPRADPDTLAYAVVRVTEGFIYNDAIVAVEPAVDQAAEIVALLLD